MRAEVLGVGTELLLGQIANTNARWISERLTEIGVDVLHHCVVGDNLDRIVAAFRLACSRADVVIATGGLGPTQDDLTRDALAIAAGARLVRRDDIAAGLRERFRRLGREMPEFNLRQADVPEGARAVTPVRGTAPGLVLDVDGARVYAVPGVPGEMQEMMEGTILPELAALAGPAGIASQTLRCVGMSESLIAELLDDLYVGSANPSLAFLAGGGEVHVRLTAKAGSLEEAAEMLEPIAQEVSGRLGDVVFSVDDEPLEQLAGRLLRERGVRIACAESVTGGGLAKRLTDVPGASAYVVGSAVCYSAEAKASVLGVSRATLEGPGAVSEACAREMAAGARRVFGADVGLSTTGVAGPEPHGGEDPGRVWIGIETEELSHARTIVAPNDREAVRRWAEQAAFDLLRRHLLGLPLAPGRS